MNAPPETQYAQSGDLSIAYQTIGDGPIDVLLVPGFVSNIELMWEIPTTARQLDRLSRIGRLIVFDKRGTGCSDRSMGTGSAEERMDDLRAVADAAGVDSANVIGLSEGGPLAVLFATTFPERVRSLVCAMVPVPRHTAHLSFATSVDRDTVCGDRRVAES